MFVALLAGLFSALLLARRRHTKIASSWTGLEDVMGEIICMFIVSIAFAYVGYCVGHGAAKLESRDDE